MEKSELKQHIFQSKLKKSLDAFPFIALNHSLIAIACFFVSQAYFYPSLNAFYWFITLCSVIALRLLQLQIMKKQLTTITQQSCLSIFYSLSSSMLGFVWSGGTILAMMKGNTHVDISVILICCGLAFGGVTYHLNNLLAFNAYFWSVFMPIIIYFIFWDNRPFEAGVLFTTGIIYSGFYARKLSIQSHQWLAESIKNEELVKQLSEANEKIQLLSETDALTGLKNRTYFNSHSQTLWYQCIKEHRSFSVILIDIDYFKPYNDNYGHISGDVTLKKVADALKSIEQEHDSALLARIGGEEFIVLLPNCDIDSAVTYAENLRLNVSKCCIPHVYSQCNDHITVSLGVSTTIPNIEKKLITFIDIADNQLYRAKKSGRDRVMYEA
ncbi:GGDEF domain-containing protein [Aliivibrio wodanis]|uniref:GGDEF domain-containing protein n=1 Tax=Aliivibrio wodanis TaxID=80852 RepID=UPI00406CB0C1